MWQLGVASVVILGQIYWGRARPRPAQRRWRCVSVVRVTQASLYNGRAVCYMKMGRWEDADHDLQEAFNKDAKDPDTLSNLITVGLHLGKNVARYQT